MKLLWRLILPELNTSPLICACLRASIRLTVVPFPILSWLVFKSPLRLRVLFWARFIFSQLRIAIFPATPLLLPVVEPVRDWLIFSVSIIPSLLLVSSPPSTTVILLIMAPRLIERVSLPLPRSILPMTFEPLFSVTLALPSPSRIARPEVAETLVPVLRVIVVVLFGLSRTTIPASVPPLIWLARVSEVLPEPELCISIALIPPLILPSNWVILTSVACSPFSAQIPYPFVAVIDPLEIISVAPYAWFIA